MERKARREEDERHEKQLEEEAKVLPSLLSSSLSAPLKHRLLTRLVRLPGERRAQGSDPREAQERGQARPLSARAIRSAIPRRRPQ